MDVELGRRSIVEWAENAPEEGSEGNGDSNLPPDVIDRRLRDLAQLHRLGMSLRGGRWIGRVSEDRRAASESGSPHPPK